MTDRERDAASAGDDRPAFDDPAQVATLTAQFYRAEVDRVATWRTRLDQTTNWAVVLIAATLTWAFTSSENPHYVLLIGMLGVFAFLFIEAQRYQEYDAWRARVLLVQRNFFAELYAPGSGDGVDWRARLASDLAEPSIRLPIWKALGHRLHRVYFPLLTVVLAAWVARITVFEAGTPWHRTAGIATIPGPAVVAGVAAGYLLAAALTGWSMALARKREFDDESASDLPRDDG